MTFTKLIYNCGLSLKGAARLLDVSYNTAASWNTGRRSVPDGVIAILSKHEVRTKQLFNKGKDNEQL